MKSRIALSATALVLVFSQATAFAAPVSSPETHLISSIIALSGRNLPTAEIQKQVSAKFTAYNAAAPMQGRTERTEQALVSLGVATQAQAQAFEAQARAAIANVGASSGANSQAIQSQLLNVVSHSSGAQFDACEVASVTDLGAFVGTIGLGLAGAPEGVLDAGIGIFVVAWCVGMVACT